LLLLLLAFYHRHILLLSILYTNIPKPFYLLLFTFTKQTLSASRGFDPYYLSKRTIIDSPYTLLGHHRLRVFNPRGAMGSWWLSMMD
jgi:hypothetical protein